MPAREGRWWISLAVWAVAAVGMGSARVAADIDAHSVVPVWTTSSRLLKSVSRWSSRSGFRRALWAVAEDRPRY